jgi:hypothetical protein
MRSTGAKSEETAGEGNSRETYRRVPGPGKGLQETFKLVEQAAVNVTTTSPELAIDWRPLRYATDEHNVTTKGGVNTPERQRKGTANLHPVRQRPPA